MNKPTASRLNMTKNTLVLPQTDTIIENYLQSYMKVFSELNTQIQDLRTRVDRLVAE
ncbi:MAG: hypothetical protein ACW981_11285 [Candidatus Hodarchaeales archaeon]